MPGSVFRDRIKGAAILVRSLTFWATALVAGKAVNASRGRKADMLGEIRGEVRFKEPLSFHTSLRIGGPADVFVRPQGLDDIRHALLFAHREQLPMTIIGGGSDVLVGAAGIRGVVLKLEGALGSVTFHGEEAVVGAGVGLSSLIRDAESRELGGVECLAGIQATIGGAVAANSGTADGRIGDFLSAVYFLDGDGSLGELKPESVASGFRSIDLPRGAVIVGARLRLRHRPLAEIHSELKQRRKAAKMRSPLALAAAGYVWKNPPGASASALIEKVGVKGKRLNGAEIAVKDPNFLVNRGGATAEQFRALMELTRERVRTYFGITLEPQIKIV